MNFRRILSKSSLKSSSTGKSVYPSEEVTKLQSEIEWLKQIIESLKVCVESRDAAIGTLAREKETLFVELKSVQRTNRNLHQQLSDDREMHVKEKEYLTDEIRKLSKNKDNSSTPEEIQSYSSWNEQLMAKDEVICNICCKYLKIKTSKQNLVTKLGKLQKQSQQICENIILLLNDNRKTLGNILRKLIKVAHLPPTNKNYLELLKMNSNLHYENTQLKVFVSSRDFIEFSNEHVNDSDRVETLERNPKTKFIKSEGRMRVDEKMDLYQSRLYKRHQFGGTSHFNFSHLHEVVSPHFRRKKYYNSDPCLMKS